jgi:16S rRNA (guanine527-N7)-methyltransferase
MNNWNIEKSSYQGIISSLLTKGALDLGLALSDAKSEQCIRYLAELIKWNRKINLTSITNERDVIIKHFLDSFSYCKGFAPRPDLKLLDLGSGAGFPALPIKVIFPEISVTLVESVRKKTSFLRHIVRTLHLCQVDIIDARAENLSDLHLYRYDVITARAFAGMIVVLRTGAKFLKPGGLMVLSRGPEESLSDDILASVGLVLDSRFELKLPFSDYRRAIWVFRNNASVPRGTECSGFQGNE